MAPPAQKEPGAHARPSASPGGSLWHVVEAFEDVARPGEQVWQVVLEVLLLKNPLGQLVHALSRARVPLNVPGTHSKHVVEPWEAA